MLNMRNERLLIGSWNIHIPANWCVCFDSSRIRFISTASSLDNEVHILYCIKCHFDRGVEDAAGNVLYIHGYVMVLLGSRLLCCCQQGHFYTNPSRILTTLIILLTLICECDCLIFSCLLHAHDEVASLSM